MDDGGPQPTARDARRQAIVDVAREVFMAEGFAETSMSAIAAQVGGSKGTLYNYFRSKQDLFSAVIQDDCDLKQAVLFDSLLAEGDDVEAVLREVGLRYTHLVLGEAAVQLSRAVIAEAVRFPELGRVLYEAGPKRGRVRLAVFMEQQMRLGRIRRADASRVVDQFCDMCLGALYRQRLMNVIEAPGDAQVQENVEAAVEVIMAAYGVKSAQGSTTQ